eukprot:TRINITY_DN12186_c0_g1_i1.p1 TRINITY_DN12186_c0_g1~~TRINITY_DN12186_c0_g1_i1.p1  ORF type:complete len:433 (+),score=118.06 TRINITY_DN12186_c0_g1_i1:103-1299(+)
MSQPDAGSGALVPLESPGGGDPALWRVARCSGLPGDAFRRRFAAVARRCVELMRELNMPATDRALFRRHLIERESAASLEKLVQLTRTLCEHKRRTLAVLAAVREREEALMRIGHAVNSLRQKRAVPQTHCLRLLHALQTATLECVESIRRWRSILTRPWAFTCSVDAWSDERRGACKRKGRGREEDRVSPPSSPRGGDNYLLKVLRDNKALQDSCLGAALGINITQYALSSDLPSLALWQDGSPGEMLLQPSGAAATAPPPQRYQRRLRQAEHYIGAEFETQLALTRELTQLCVAGYFVPLLATPLVPNCRSGVRMCSEHWEKRLAWTLRRAHEDLTRPPPLPEGWRALVGAASDGREPTPDEPVSERFRGGGGDDGSTADFASDYASSDDPSARVD